MNCSLLIRFPFLVTLVQVYVIPYEGHIFYRRDDVSLIISYLPGFFAKIGSRNFTRRNFQTLQYSSICELNAIFSVFISGSARFCLKCENFKDVK